MDFIIDFFRWLVSSPVITLGFVVVVWLGCMWFVCIRQMKNNNLNRGQQPNDKIEEVRKKWKECEKDDR
ncbi:MAG: hypothetical protein IKH50_00190 [Oscillospiraceae bacterium]|nr:hypothetical protein [Oscillospiraceae bacterium]